MLAQLYHAPSTGVEDSVGTSTLGSSEAIMLAGLAMKKRWQARMEAQGKPTNKPNLIMGCMLWSSSRPTARDPPCIRCHGVGWQDPAPLTQLVSQVKLGVLASLLLAVLVHSLGQAEGHQGQGIVLAQNPEVPCSSATSLMVW